MITGIDYSVDISTDGWLFGYASIVLFLSPPLLWKKFCF